MPVPSEFAGKSPEQIRAQLRGLPASTVDAALRYRESGNLDDLFAMLPGLIAYHLPRGSKSPPEVLSDDLRLSQDLGLDSLALSEMAFKMDELFDLRIETNEVMGLETVGALKAFLSSKLAP